MLFSMLAGPSFLPHVSIFQSKDEHEIGFRFQCKMSMKE